MLSAFYKYNEQELTIDIKDENGYQFVDFHGEGGCFPKVTYSLHKIHILELKPTNENCLSVSVHTMLVHKYSPYFVLFRDRKGDY